MSEYPRPPSGVDRHRNRLTLAHIPTAAAATTVHPNPFLGRDNFPAFEEVFQTTMSEQSQSFGSSSQSSSVNLSIGARAALDEHLRHVAKFGLDNSNDDDIDNPKRQHPTISSSPTTTSVPPPQRHPLDEQWEKLVRTTSETSSSLFPNNSSTGPADSSSTCINDNEAAAAMEITTDVSSSFDFFNSSRVNLLRTPEKLHSLRIEAVFRRGDNDDDDDDDDSVTSSSRRFLFPTSTAAPDTSFASSLLSAVDTANSSRISGCLDISRISSNAPDDRSSDGMRRSSPDVSLLASNPENRHPERRDPTMMQAWHPPPMSGSILPPPHGTTLPNKRFPPSSTSSPPPRNHNFDASLLYEKENDPDIVHHLDTLGLSPISSLRAGAAVRRENPMDDKVQDDDQGAESGTSFVVQEEFLPLGQISHDEASNKSSPLRLSEVLYDRTHDSDISTLPNQSSPTKNTSSSSSGSLLVDRRQFRTVVPARVFLKDPKDFPEHYDSFSAPPRISKRRLDPRIHQGSTIRSAP